MSICLIHELKFTHVVIMALCKQAQYKKEIAWHAATSQAKHTCRSIWKCIWIVLEDSCHQTARLSYRRFVSFSLFPKRPECHNISDRARYQLSLSITFVSFQTYKCLHHIASCTVFRLNLNCKQWVNTRARDRKCIKWIVPVVVLNEAQKHRHPLHSSTQEAELNKKCNQDLQFSREENDIVNCRQLIGRNQGLTNKATQPCLSVHP